MRRLLASILVLLGVWGLAACTGAPPEIVQTQVRIRFVDNRTSEARYEQLELFVLADDDDGFGDLSALYLVHEEQELSWELDVSKWQVVSVNEQRWIGSAGFAPPEGGRMPRGAYRVIVEDVAGERADSSFVLSAPEMDPDRYRGPTLRVQQDAVYLDSPIRRNRVELRDARGQLVRAFSAEPGRLSADRLAGRADSSSADSASLPRLVDLYVFAESAEGALFVSGPYRL